MWMVGIVVCCAVISYSNLGVLKELLSLQCKELLRIE